MLEAAKVNNPTLGTPGPAGSAASAGSAPGAGAANVVIPAMDWEKYVGLLATDVLREQSPRSLLACRAKIYELLVNCIPADAIVRRLAWVLTSEQGRGMPEALKHEVMHWAAHYEHRLALGSGGKEVFHIEALCAKLMAVIKAAPPMPPPGAGAPGMGAGSAAAR